MRIVKKILKTTHEKYALTKNDNIYLKRFLSHFTRKEFQSITYFNG